MRAERGERAPQDGATFTEGEITWRPIHRTGGAGWKRFETPPCPITSSDWPPPRCCRWWPATGAVTPAQNAGATALASVALPSSTEPVLGCSVRHGLRVDRGCGPARFSHRRHAQRASPPRRRTARHARFCLGLATGPARPEQGQGGGACRARPQMSATAPHAPAARPARVAAARRMRIPASSKVFLATHGMLDAAREKAVCEEKHLEHPFPLIMGLRNWLFAYLPKEP